MGKTDYIEFATKDLLRITFTLFIGVLAWVFVGLTDEVKETKRNLDDLSRKLENISARLDVCEKR
jgi:hypothetical protein